MPKDTKKNIQNYQLRGGHLNEFEFQRSQSEMAQERGLPFHDETEKPNLAQATRAVAEVAAEAHEIVEKRKKRGLVKAGDRKTVTVTKRTAKKVAPKSAKKKAIQAATKKRTGTKKRATAKNKRTTSTNR